jgi:hypothetical protein
LSWLEELAESVEDPDFGSTVQGVRLTVLEEMILQAGKLTEIGRAARLAFENWCVYARKEMLLLPGDRESAIGECSALEGLLLTDGDIIVKVMNVFQHLEGELCHALNSLVSHEAVHTLQKRARTKMPLLQLSLRGAGCKAALTVMPPRIPCYGVLTVGQSWGTRFDIQNPSFAHLEVEWGDPEVCMKGSDNFSRFYDEYMEISVDPDRAVAMAESFVRCDVTVRVSATEQ